MSFVGRKNEKLQELQKKIAEHKLFGGMKNKKLQKKIAEQLQNARESMINPAMLEKIRVAEGMLEDIQNGIIVIPKKKQAYSTLSDISKLLDQAMMNIRNGSSEQVQLNFEHILTRIGNLPLLEGVKFKDIDYTPEELFANALAQLNDKLTSIQKEKAAIEKELAREPSNYVLQSKIDTLTLREKGCKDELQLFSDKVAAEVVLSTANSLGAKYQYVLSHRTLSDETFSEAIQSYKKLKEEIEESRRIINDGKEAIMGPSANVAGNNQTTPDIQTPNGAATVTPEPTVASATENLRTFNQLGRDASKDAERTIAKLNEKIEATFQRHEQCSQLLNQWLDVRKPADESKRRLMDPKIDMLSSERKKCDVKIKMLSQAVQKLIKYREIADRAAMVQDIQDLSNSSGINLDIDQLQGIVTDIRTITNSLNEELEEMGTITDVLDSINIDLGDTMASVDYISNLGNTDNKYAELERTLGRRQ